MLHHVHQRHVLRIGDFARTSQNDMRESVSEHDIYLCIAHILDMEHNTKFESSRRRFLGANNAGMLTCWFLANKSSAPGGSLDVIKLNI
jgi:hypothetical protein